MSSCGPAFFASDGSIDTRLKLWLKGEGANNSTTFTDSSSFARTVTIQTGSPVISTAQAEYGSASISFPGSANLSVASSSDFDMGSGDFTLSAWIRPSSIPGAGTYMGLITKRDTGSSQHAFSLHLNGDNSGAVRIDFGPGGPTSCLGAIPTANVWNHVAAVRNGTSLKIYLNGVGSTSVNVSTTALPTSGQPVDIGRLSHSIAGSFFVGYMDDVRVYKGLAVYTADFTPPATEPAP